MLTALTLGGFTAILILSGTVTERIHLGSRVSSDCCLDDGAVAGGGYEHMGTIKVSSASALNKALSSAKAGDIILLAPGNYGNVRISNRNYSGSVTIMSANPGDMAHIDRLIVENTNNLVFKKVDIGGEAFATDKSSYLAEVRNSKNITFDSVHIHGLIDGDAAHERSGLSIRSSNSIKVIGSEFQELLRGAWVQRSNNVEVLGNSFHDIRMDGLAVAAATKMMIDGNKFTDFHRQKEDHSDAIQFWTTNETTPSTDIIIRNNQIMQGSGTAMQGIFMRDETERLPYERVLIENNLVYESGYANGITVIGGNAITMKGNTVVSQTGDKFTTKIRLEDVTGAVIIKNVTDMFVQLGKNSGLSFDGNVTLSTSPSAVKNLGDIGLGASATARGLILQGAGFQLMNNTPTSGAGTVLKPSAMAAPVPVKAEPIPAAFSPPGLYTAGYSYAAPANAIIPAAPLPAAAATSWGRTIQPLAQLFHA